MITPIIIEGDVVFELTVSSSDAERTEFFVAGLSERFSQADAIFEYRLPGQDWQDDAVLVDLALFRNSSQVFGIQCSPSGNTSFLVWNHAANGITLGCPCEVRLRPLPSRLIHGWSGSASFSDAVGVQGVSAHESYSQRVLGYDLDGNKMTVSGSGKFEVVGDTGAIFTLTSYGVPHRAQQTREGLYLVLYASSVIVETDSAGAETSRSPINLSAVDSSIAHFFYDDVSQTMLVSGRTGNVVKQITWGNTAAGVVLDSIAGLNAPSGVCYHNDRSIWLIADEGNNRVLIADRTSAVTTPITNVTVGGHIVPLVAPQLVESFPDGRIGIIESIGAPLAYAGTPTTHPTLARAKGLGPDEFRNFVFPPILRAQ